MKVLLIIFFIANSFFAKADIFIGAKSSAITCESGDIFAAGYNNHKQFGNIDNQTIIEEYSKIDLSSSIIDIAIVESFTAYLEDNGKVYILGRIDPFKPVIETPKYLTTADSIIAIISGNECVIAESAQGNFFFVGLNDSLVHSEDRNIDDFVKIDAPADVVAHSAGQIFSTNLFVTSLGDVYVTGYDFSDDPFSVEAKSTSTRKIGGFPKINNAWECGVKAVFEDVDRNYWFIGDNFTRRIIDTTAAFIKTPIRIDWIENAVKVIGAPQQVVFLKTDGTVWGKGLNFGHENARVDSFNTAVVQIDVPERITDIYNHRTNYIFVSETGIMYAYGPGEDYIFGADTPTDNYEQYAIITNPCTPVSVEESYDFTEDVIIYPNPACNYIQIKGINNPESIKIYDTKGSLIEQYNDFSGEIDISNYPKGIYYVHILPSEADRPIIGHFVIN